MSATRCHVCSRACEREVEPAVGDTAAVFEPDVWTVAMRNGLYVAACQSCWFMWPDDHKLFPPVGFRRWPDERPGRATVSIHELVDVLQDTA